MASDLNSFNFIARFYDSLVQLVFGNQLREAQKIYLSSVPLNANVLIVGGGSGDIVLDIRSLTHFKGSITYLDASSEMIALAKKKITGLRNDFTIRFIHGTEEAIPSQKYDVVITNFFFDLFKEDKLREVISKIDDNTHCDTTWLVTDFHSTSRLSHRLLLWIMYRFFVITSRIEAHKLPEWIDVFNDFGWVLSASTVFRNGLIRSEAFRRVNE